ncbi:MAG: hypothetical protein ACO3TX_13330, partial [Pseudomonadales bacterium]
MNWGALFSTGYTRKPSGIMGYVLTGYAALFAVWSVYAANFAVMDPLAIVTLFLSFMLVLVFSTISAVPDRPDERADQIPWIDLGLAGLSIACGVYFATNLEAISTRITLLDPLSTVDKFFATVLILMCLEVCRR